MTGAAGPIASVVAGWGGCLQGMGGGQSPSLASQDDAAEWVEERDAWSRLGSQLIRPQRDSSSVRLEIQTRIVFVEKSGR